MIYVAWRSEKIWILYFDWDNGKITYVHIFWVDKTIWGGDKYLQGFFKNINPNVWNKLFKRSLYIDNGIWHPEQISVGEDLATTPRLIYYAKRIRRIEKAYVHYIQRRSSIMNSTKKLKTKEDLLSVKKELARFFVGQEPSGFIEWQLEGLVCCLMQENGFEVDRDVYDICYKHKNIEVKNKKYKKLINLFAKCPNYSIFKLVLWYKKLEYRIKKK